MYASDLDPPRLTESFDYTLEVMCSLKNKEVFVKHEQAPTAPKLEGARVFVDLKYISYENRYFWPI